MRGARTGWEIAVLPLDNHQGLSRRFLGGGSGGIGTVAHGMLRDFQTGSEQLK